MARPKFTLTASPTFKALVRVPVAGGKPEAVEFTFRHRTKTEIIEFQKGMGTKEDVDLALEAASGWDLEEPFDRENLDELFENYPGSALVLFQTYFAELSGQRAGN